jgi:NADH:quinone reductase (non-electrogenic)
MGLIDDIPTCAELISRIVEGAEDLITERLSGMVTPSEPVAVSA